MGAPQNSCAWIRWVTVQPHSVSHLNQEHSACVPVSVGAASAANLASKSSPGKNSITTWTAPNQKRGISYARRGIRPDANDSTQQTLAFVLSETSRLKPLLRITVVQRTKRTRLGVKRKPVEAKCAIYNGYNVAKKNGSPWAPVKNNRRGLS